MYELEPSGGRPAVGGFPIVVVGRNLGLPAPRVHIGDLPCAVDSSRLPPSNHTHAYCVAPRRQFTVPSALVVTQDGQRSVAVPFRYSPPVVTRVTPAWFSAAALGRSEASVLSVHGSNLGVPETLPVDAASLHAVVLGANATCEVLQWVSDALVLCRPIGDFLVGPVDVTLTLAGVDSATLLRAATTALCPEHYYGGVGEACLPCPVGARCPGGLFDPHSLQG